LSVRQVTGSAEGRIDNAGCGQAGDAGTDIGNDDNFFCVALDKKRGDVDE